MYDDSEKQLSGDIKINYRTQEKVSRPKGMTLPCKQCPKEDPEMGAKIDAYIYRAYRLLQRYYQSRATGGRSLSWKELHDTFTLKVLSIAEEYVQMHNSKNLAQSLAPLVEASQ